MKKRVLCIFLVLVMVLSITPLSALAEDYPSISLGEEFFVELSEGSSVWYQFVPEKTAIYEYSSFDEDGVDPFCKVYDSKMTLISEADDNNGSNFSNTVQLTAGETYYFEFFEFDKNNVGSYKAKISLPTPIHMEITPCDYTPYVGCEFALEVYYYPNNGETVTWTSSDDKVATVDENGKVKLVGVGEAIITASLECGLYDTFEIVSKPSESINLGDVKTVTMDGTLPKRDIIGAFRFIPEETAYYRLYSYDIVTLSPDTEVDPRVWLRDDYYNELGYNDDGGEDVNVSLQGMLEAGKQYFFLVEPYDFKAIGEFKVTLEKCVKAESIVIDCGDTIGERGSYIDLYTTQYPEGCGIESVTFSSSDENVVRIEDQTAFFVGEGEATVTVRTESGLTSSITITVLPIDSISVDQTFSIECSDNAYGGYEKFIFVPTESGVYRIESIKIDGEWDPAISVSDQYSQLRYNEDIGDDLNCRLDYEFVAGETYFIEASAKGDVSASGSVDFKLTKVDESKFPAIVINSSDEIVIDVAATGKYYVFKPTVSGMYSIFSTPISDYFDTKVYVFDENWELLYADDDDGGNSQYNLEEEFTAGETYYIKTFLYSNDDTGSYYNNIKFLDGDIVCVTFDANGGGGTIENVFLASGSKYALPENIFTAPTGMKFKAWSVNGVEKAVGEVIDVTQDTTVIAVWEEYVSDIIGDINGDFEVTPIDYFLLKRFCLNYYDLTEAQTHCADIDKDGEVDASDYMLLKSACLGEYTIE